MFPQQQTYYPQPSNRPMMVQQGLKGYPVSSLEEARASVVDFDGSVFFFPDIINKKIYTKQINLDGTAAINVYELKTIDQTTTTSQYITRKEFEETINQLYYALKPAEDGGQPTAQSAETTQKALFDF